MQRHRGAFEYDWRSRFSLPLTVIPKRMSYAEALRLTQLLVSDPSSQVFAALAGWSFPVSREWIVAADHRDSTEFGRVGRRARAYPRPWTDQPRRIGRGKGTSSSQLHQRITQHHQAKRRLAEQEATDG
jgi:hypothetical protein